MQKRLRNENSRFFIGVDNISRRIIEDYEFMSIKMENNIIIIDLRECDNPAFYQLVLLNIAKMQASRSDKENTRTVEVILNHKDKRIYKISNQIDALNINQGIFNDKRMQFFKV